MDLKRAFLGIAIVALMIIVSGPIAGFLRGVGVPINP